MSKINHHLKTFAALSLGLYLGILAPIQSASAGQLLRTGVRQDSTLQGQDNAPGLSRTDINNNNSGDPFSNGSDQFAPASFAVEQAAPPMPPPKKAFGLNANTDGDAFNPQMGNPMADRAPQQAPRQASAMTPNNFAPQDPEESGEMKLAWDAWHKRVASAVYERYSGLSNAAFRRSGRPLQASASYVVTCDGRIMNVQLLVRSSDPIYNTLIIGVINSLSGDYGLLQFPPGSHRRMVEKSATFSQNMGNEGYKFLTGDSETVRQRQMQQQRMMQQQQFGR